MTGACRQCRGPIPGQPAGKPGAKPKFCSDDCRRGQGRKQRACGECGGDVKGHWKRCATCRAKERAEATGDRRCERCNQPIPDHRAAHAKFCSKECKNTATWGRLRAKRDAEAKEAAAAEAAGTAPVRRYRRGTRNAEAREAERDRSAAIRTRLDERLWNIDRAAAEGFKRQRGCYDRRDRSGRRD